MDHAAVPARAGIMLRSGLHEPHARIRDDEPGRLQPAGLEVLEETAPAFEVFLAPFGDTQDGAKAVFAYADGYQHR